MFVCVCVCACVFVGTLRVITSENLSVESRPFWPSLKIILQVEVCLFTVNQCTAAEYSKQPLETVSQEE